MVVGGSLFFLSSFLRFLLADLRLREAMLCSSSELTGNIVDRRYMAASLSSDESLEEFTIWERVSMWWRISAGDWLPLGALGVRLKQYLLILKGGRGS